MKKVFAACGLAVAAVLVIFALASGKPDQSPSQVPATAPSSSAPTQ